MPSPINRRNFIAGTAATVLGVSRVRADDPILTEDGFYRQKWFLESFLDLADDLDGAAKAGKRFVIMWELRGCPYCKETHFVNFGQPRIADFVRSNFEVLQLNVIGSRKVTDFDGTELSEKALAARYGVRFTPTFQFFPERAAGLKDVPPTKREVARLSGYMRPDDFLAMFRFVKEKAYEGKSFRDYVKSQSG